MIVSFIFVIILCGAFSLPFPITSDNQFKFNLKRHARLQQPSFDYQNPSYPEDSPLELRIDHDETKRKVDATRWEDIFTPRKLWSLHCEPNCPAEYNSDSGEDSEAARQNDDDILLHLSDDKDLMKILKWTMVHLGSLHSYNASGNNYYPGLNIWTNLNLSGRRELPLYVEEPQYIVVRREKEDLEPDLNSSPGIPFIPPRGRKYIPNLENLLQRYELFVPNRGKKDILKDIFKYDDLFFPNRGKKSHDTLPHSNSYQQTEGVQKRHRSLGVCFTHCDDITFVPTASAPEATDQAANINGPVSASTLHLPPMLSSLQVSSSALDANADGHHQDAVRCDVAAAGAVADCQKENNVKINGFDQSVRAQIHQRQHSKGGASNAADHRRLLSSSAAAAAASVEAGASSFLPLIRPDQVRRLQAYPIRNKQWRDYYF